MKSVSEKNKHVALMQSLRYVYAPVSVYTIQHCSVFRQFGLYNTNNKPSLGEP